MQEILGIEPTGAGFREVTIRPDLAGLQWARGAEPTPRGLLRVEVERGTVRVTLPHDTIATVILPFPPVQGKVIENGKPVVAVAAEGGTRSRVTLPIAGDYTFTSLGN
jgi:hypothetical protein